MKPQNLNSFLASVRIRSIQPQDNEAMAALVRMNLKSVGLDIPGTAYFDPELAHLDRFYAEKPTRRAYFVAESRDGAILGGAGFSEFAAFDGWAEMQKLYLADVAKRKGLGSALVRLVEDTARSFGYRQLYLETHTALAAACCMYERLGFLPIERPDCVQHGTMNRFYCKAL